MILDLSSTQVLWISKKRCCTFTANLTSFSEKEEASIVKIFSKVKL